MPYQRKDRELFNNGGAGVANDGAFGTFDDLAAHDSAYIAFADYERPVAVTFLMENWMDQDIDAQFIGGDDSAFTHWQDIDNPITIAKKAGAVPGREYAVLNSDYFDALKLSGICGIAPTSGYFFVKVISVVEIRP